MAFSGYSPGLYVWNNRCLFIVIVLSYNEAICVSTSHMLSANLKAGDNVRVVPLEKEKSTFNLPTLKGIRRAQHIAVAEVDDLNRPIPQKSKKQDWLALYLREVLGDNTRKRRNTFFYLSHIIFFIQLT